MMSNLLKGSLAFCLIFLLVGIAVRVTWGSLPIRHAMRGNLSSGPTPQEQKVVQTQAGAILLFSTAQDVETIAAELPQTGHINFTTSASLQDVVDFYKEASPAQGWVLNYQEEYLGGYTLEFSQPNKEESESIRRFLGISLRKEANHNTVVGIFYSLWPDPDDISVYPGASHLKVEWTIDQEYRFPVKVTTYVVSSAPVSVEDFYKDAMIRKGWQKSKNPRYPGMSFTYSRGGAERMFTYTVVVRIILNSGKTTVELRTFGTGITQASISNP